LRPIQSELPTGPPDDTKIEDFVRTSERNFRLPAFPMDRHHDMTFMPPLMLMPIEPASLLA